METLIRTHEIRFRDFGVHQLVPPINRNERDRQGQKTFGENLRHIYLLGNPES